MSNAFLAEIRIFSGNFAPTGWAECNGQLLPISQNTALFSLLGTFYGGDGKSTFALPNLQGSAPMHPGQGAGLSQRFLGEQSGSQFITLLESEMPFHNHSASARSSLSTQNSPVGNLWSGNTDANQYIEEAPNVQMAFQSIAPAGGSLPHNNMPPFLCLNFLIALQGVFPSRP
jgi:microcystin-dependent protein